MAPFFLGGEMKKLIRIVAASAIALILFASCATTSNVDESAGAKTEVAEKSVKAEKPAKHKKKKFDQKAYDAAFEAGDYETCLAMLNGKKPDKEDLIKDMLDENMLMYILKDYTCAGKGFLETYSAMQQLSSEMTAGDVMKASFARETSVTYSGAEYERYLAWSMRLSSAMNLHQTDVAKGIMNDYVGTFMQEIQELREKNRQSAEESAKKLESDEFANAQNKLASSGARVNTSNKPKAGKETYENSKFFNYLGTLAYALNDDFEHAQQFASTYGVSNVNEVINVPKGKGRLEVVALSGIIGKRSDSGEGQEAEGMSINVGGNLVPLYSKIVYPVFKPQEHLINNVRVTLSDDSKATALLIEDFDKAVEIDVNQKAPGAYSRSVFRNVVKNSTATASVIAAGVGLQNAKGNKVALTIAKIAFDAAVNAAAKAVISAEAADTRQGEYFPHKASAAGFSVAPGTYNVKIEYLHDNAVVETKTIENVVVKEGKLNVVVSSCEK